MSKMIQYIDGLLNNNIYGMPPFEKHKMLLRILREQVMIAAANNPFYKNYVNGWPQKPEEVTIITELPYLPVSVFKRNPPIVLIEYSNIKRIITSSSTTGQIPSHIAIDSVTAKHMTRGVASIVSDYIGPQRRPYLVIDEPESNKNKLTLSARGTAIRGLQTFAQETVYVLKRDAHGNLAIDMDKINKFLASNRDLPVLVYGFTYILWAYFAKPLLEKGVCLNMPNIHIMHSGGWKKLLDQSVSKTEFNNGLAKVFGCSSKRIIDFYGMVENIGIIYPDCPEGNKHSPSFGEVIVRNPLTLQPVDEGGIGVVQVCSILPSSFPGHLLLTEDMAKVVHYDNCPCGRRGVAFQFLGRIPKSEIRGCANISPV